MDIEQLSKSQIVLLTLLVTFVTSIATGIVTVSLMDQAPPVVAQTVNRVIERTIETVAATSTPRGQAASSVVTQEKTVVVRESDLISQAVAKAAPSLVRIYTNSDGTGTQTFLGIGIMLDDQGYVFTDAAALGENADATLTLPDGTRVRAFVTKRDKDTGFIYLQATSTPESVVWHPIGIAKDHPVLGQTIVALSGKTVARIAPGIITALQSSDASVAIIDSNVPTEGIVPGAPIIGTDGALVGVSTSVSRSSSPSGFISAGVLLTPSAPSNS